MDAEVKHDIVKRTYESVCNMLPIIQAQMGTLKFQMQTHHEGTTLHIEVIPLPPDTPTIAWRRVGDRIVT